MDLFKIFGTIAIENENAIKSIDDTTKSASDAEGKINTAFQKIGTAIATYLTVDAIVKFGEKCLESAANAQAMESQFTQVFGELEGRAAGNLTAIADSTGIVENRMKGSYTQIAAFAKTTGMDTADALSLADRAMVAVADSAAFYDRSLEDVTDSLQSFLKGNYENDAALGLSCTETTRNAAANELYGKSFNDLSEAQKQLTLLQMVEDANAASGALGQAARESDTWTNQTGNLKQSWTDLTAAIGEKFLPVAIEVVEALSNMVTWLTDNQTVVALVAIAVGTLTAALIAYNIAQSLAAAGTTLLTVATTAFGTVMAFVTSPITLVILAIGALIAIGVLLYQNWDVIKAKAVELWQNLVAKFEQLKTSVSEKFQAIKQAISDAFTQAKDKVMEIWQNIKDTFADALSIGQKIVDDIKQGINDAWAGLTSWFGGLWDSLFGGRSVDVSVNATASGTGVDGSHASGLNYVPFDGYIAELHRGEMVVPADEARTLRSGGSSTENQQIILLLQILIDIISQGNSEILRALMSGQTIKLNEREIGRTVRAYA